MALNSTLVDTSIDSKRLADAQALIGDHPDWTRRRLSINLCEKWNWRSANGRLRDMACRALLLRWHRAGLIPLPPPRCKSNNDPATWHIPDIPHHTDPVDEDLECLQPIRCELVDDREQLQLLKCVLGRYHYLGYRGLPGESAGYLIYDRYHRLLACMVFGAAARRLQARDQFIGWDDHIRALNLNAITNNIRFLILPNVRCHSLASHILATVSRRIADDYFQRYCRRIVLLESFVDAARFKAVCYRAANWIHIGKTTGRTRQDRKHTLHVPQKDVYIYPLQRHFRRSLCLCSCS